MEAVHFRASRYVRGQPRVCFQMQLRLPRLASKRIDTSHIDSDQKVTRIETVEKHVPARVFRIGFHFLVARLRGRIYVAEASDRVTPGRVVDGRHGVGVEVEDRRDLFIDDLHLLSLEVIARNLRVGFASRLGHRAAGSFTGGLVAEIRVCRRSQRQYGSQ
jgi:hypothetical protein